MPARAAALAQRRGSWAIWLVPPALILVAIVPMITGGLRLTQLGGGPAIMPEAARFTDFPLPVVAHIIAGVLFSLLGAFQFVPALRLGRRSWHRAVGVVLIPAGFVVALSALWMASFSDLPPGDGPALLVIRWVFGAYMVLTLVLAVRALTQRRYATHGAWMTRAYALGIAAGTQAYVLIPGSILYGPDDQVSRAIAMTIGWLINLGVAELVIWRRKARRARL
ncbi:DUF2306 domain-containing protein [Agrococcus baldri]|nr:DUF2306 domain-containing protein [Agrococcus baldri]